MHFDEEMGLNLQNLLMKSQDASRKEELTSGENGVGWGGVHALPVLLTSSWKALRERLGEDQVWVGGVAEACTLKVHL